MQRLIMERFYAFLGSKVISSEERGLDGKNQMIRISIEDLSKASKERYGGTVPVITIEYDKLTSFMHDITITYNRRMAKK